MSATVSYKDTIRRSFSRDIGLHQLTFEDQGDDEKGTPDKLNEEKTNNTTSMPK